MPFDVKDMLEHFHFSANVTILFNGWHVTTAPGMLGSCAVVILLAFFFEVLKTFRTLHLQQYATSVRHRIVESATEKSRILETQAEGELKILSWPHGIQSLLHVLQAVIGYMLMLIVMTYNGWLILSVLIGIGLGYFASAWKRKIHVDVEETAK
ncbi:high affinity copper uptake protein 1-like [Patiria miniata]|uniref:Copper transport protein n=1 Tax=Patiria miniata TaxID=46514 RepID=A0A914AKL1_PATMI|nr:high affinity copper uptake protein 1-like [Patiria miniata]